MSDAKDMLDDEQFEELKRIIADAKDCSALSQWEEEFLEKTEERVDQYEDRVFVSEKQWAVLKRIREKIDG